MAMNMMVIAREGCSPRRPLPHIHGGNFPNSRKPNTVSVKPTFLAFSERFQEDPHDVEGKKNAKTHNSHWFSVINFKLDKPSVALAIGATNAWMVTSPLNALAETCETDKSVFNMPLLLLVSIIGATVGGLLARQRKGELQRLNEQLRQINAALRRQAKIESYAPSLSYAPVGGRIAEDEVIVDSRKQDLISRLRNGKTFLRNQNPEKAFFEFKAALELAQTLKYPREEKKAARGLGASLQRQGKYREAINYHSMVLEISKREGEESGDAEAYGAIADCYTEVGDLEKAAKFYDHYIARLETD